MAHLLIGILSHLFSGVIAHSLASVIKHSAHALRGIHWATHVRVLVGGFNYAKWWGKGKR